MSRPRLRLSVECLDQRLTLDGSGDLGISVVVPPITTPPADVVLTSALQPAETLQPPTFPRPAFNPWSTNWTIDVIKPLPYYNPMQI